MKTCCPTDRESNLLISKTSFKKEHISLMSLALLEIVGFSNLLIEGHYQHMVKAPEHPLAAPLAILTCH
jgi:hypothetical protein